MNENCVYIRSCKMVLWPIRARVLFKLFYKESCNKGSLPEEKEVELNKKLQFAKKILHTSSPIYCSLVIHRSHS